MKYLEKQKISINYLLYINTIKIFILKIKPTTVSPINISCKILIASGFNSK